MQSRLLVGSNKDASFLKLSKKISLFEELNHAKIIFLSIYVHNNWADI
jgi:hypothetical protein